MVQFYHPPFVRKRETKNRDRTSYTKKIFFCQYLVETPFLCKLFRAFQESNDKTCKQGSNRIRPKSLFKRPRETPQVGADERAQHASHP